MIVSFTPYVRRRFSSRIMFSSIDFLTALLCSVTVLPSHMAQGIQIIVSSSQLVLTITKLYLETSEFYNSERDMLLGLINELMRHR
ncbi:hypothetical protein ABKN59_011614 [Abortiporus biennis]